MTDRPQFHFDPATYDEVISEIPAYNELQDQTARASEGLAVERILELGVGTGETLRRLRARHPGAALVGIDESHEMLRHARERLGEAELRVGRLEDELPDGPFDLVVSALTVHHLDGAQKTDLFLRIAKVLRAGGRFVLADVVVPKDPSDVVTPVDGVHDKPSSVAEQIAWLEEAGLSVEVIWTERDLAVLAAERPAG